MSSTGQVANPVSPTGEVGQLPPRDLARPARRLAAFVVDIVILSVLLTPLLVPVVSARLAHEKALAVAEVMPAADPVPALPFWTSEWFVGAVTVVLFGLYRVPQVAGFGRTLGHRLLGLRVVTFTGKRKVSAGRALLRYVAFYGINVVPVIGSFFTFVSYLWCVFDKPYCQCLHDKVAGTFVIRPGGNQPASE